jgi:hypothetical protein
MTRILPFVLLALASLTISAIGQDDTNDAELYRLAISAAIPSLTANDRIALADTTVDISGAWRDAELAPGHPYLHPRTRITYAKPETVEAFITASAMRARLPGTLKNAPELFLASQKRLDQLTAAPPGGRDGRINRLRPGSTASVSSIGDDKARSEALLYVSYSCGSLCGQGSFVFLKRDSGAWRVAKLDEYVQS